MNMLALENIGNFFSTVFEKFQHNGRVLGNFTDVGTSTDDLARFSSDLQFHQIHGETISLFENEKVAVRTGQGFENSVVFSNRPVSSSEVIAVEISKMTEMFCGPLKIGFTSIDPTMYETVPSGRGLSSNPGNWLQGVLLHRINIGTVVYFKFDDKGTILHGINGGKLGALRSGIDVSQPLWAVLEVYGSVEAIKFVEKPIFLDNTQPPIDENSERHDLCCCGNPLSLLSRRNVQLCPLALQNINSAVTEVSSPTSYSTPLEVPCSPLLCIICLEREKNTAFSNCGHLCMCYHCADEFLNQRSNQRRNLCPLCPICRRPISSLFRVYT